MQGSLISLTFILICSLMKGLYKYITKFNTPSPPPLQCLAFADCSLHIGLNHSAPVSLNNAPVSLYSAQVSLFTVSFRLWKWNTILVRKSTQSANVIEKTYFTVKRNSGNCPRSTFVPLVLKRLDLKLNVTPEQSTLSLPF